MRVSPLSSMLMCVCVRIRPPPWNQFAGACFSGGILRLEVSLQASELDDFNIKWQWEYMQATARNGRFCGMRRQGGTKTSPTSNNVLFALDVKALLRRSCSCAAES